MKKKVILFSLALVTSIIASPQMVESVSALQITYPSQTLPKRSGGRIAGHVFNGDTGRSISGAFVVAKDFDTGRVIRVKTDSNGYYCMDNVPDGWYRITSFADGYRSYSSRMSGWTIQDGSIIDSLIVTLMPD